ncbi:MAG: hypothetical protein LBF40_07620 [Deltaproteobacteria bacterium]|jgi:OOP family OmpA-OmpF porin|nr:hypothetical protein [Deltaproteobacteria bacterium]
MGFFSRLFSKGPGKGPTGPEPPGGANGAPPGDLSPEDGPELTKDLSEDSLPPDDDPSIGDIPPQEGLRDLDVGYEAAGEPGAMEVDQGGEDHDRAIEEAGPGEAGPGEAGPEEGHFPSQDGTDDTARAEEASAHEASANDAASAYDAASPSPETEKHEQGPEATEETEPIAEAPEEAYQAPESPGPSEDTQEHDEAADPGPVAAEDPGVDEDGFQKAEHKSKDRIQETEDKLLSELDMYFLDEPEPAPAPAIAPLGGGEAPQGGPGDGGDAGGLPAGEGPGDGHGFAHDEAEDAAKHADKWHQSLLQDDDIPPLPAPDSDFGQLRNLLLERELKQLDKLTNVLGDPQALAGTVSHVVTEALLLRSNRDDKLNTVLAPTVEKIVSSSVRRNPETLANQIFPVIGPAIRKSISDAFSSMLQSFNNTLEMSLSLKGLKWRLEALRVHKPFSEIVLLHTLVYHVEEIYLIHAESGLMLDHLVAEGGEERDADLVAAMFTAIRDFIRDSFSVGQTENLDNLRFGERTIYLMRSDEVFMAAVVRGNPPATLTTELQAALELMVVDAADDLAEFKGDTKPFKRYRVFFEPFLVAQYQDPKTLPFLVRKAPIIALLLIALFFGSLWYEKRSERRHGAALAASDRELAEASARSRLRYLAVEEAALNKLNQVPGLAVGSVGRLPGGRLAIVCLKDELAPDPAAILAGPGGLGEGTFAVVIKPFVSMDPPIVLQRVEKAIPLPKGVTMHYDQATGALTLAGQANLGWIMETRERALTIPGVSSLDFTGLTDPRTSQMQELVDEINGVVIHFPLNKADPVPDDQAKLNKAVDDLVALERLCSQMQISVSLVIYGHADAIGQPRRNYELSLERSHTVAALLYTRGSFMPIRNLGMGSRASGSESGENEEDPDKRRIELRVLVGAEDSAPEGHLAQGPGQAKDPD